METNWFESAVLGIVQGLTEFLPVSSSGHLEIAKVLLGNSKVPEESMLMTVVLHFATSLSTIVIFRKEILAILKGLFSKEMNEEKKFSFNIILSMIPAVVVGLLFEKQIESFFTGNMMLVSSMLILTAILLFFADKAKNTDKGITPLNAFIVGISQAIAILPGISRSGATISTTVLLGVDRTQAAKFSFLMVVPLIIGKMAKDILDGALVSDHVNVTELSIGFICAFVAGLFACNWMIALVRKSKLTYFSVYCAIVGITGVLFSIL